MTKLLQAFQSSSRSLRELSEDHGRLSSSDLKAEIFKVHFCGTRGIAFFTLLEPGFPRVDEKIAAVFCQKIERALSHPALCSPSLPAG
jgi:hypothetical protein